MNVTREDRKNVVILRLDGRLTGGAESEPLYAAVQGAVADGRRDILLDLERIPWVDSPGLGVLMSIHTLLRKESGVMKLLNLSARIQSILDVTKLNTVFESFDDQDAALQSFER